MANSSTVKASVKSKIPCIFQSIVVPNAPSSKRPDQQHKVVASNQLHPDALDVIDHPSLISTEKIDGTCTLVREYDGKPWLWARHDRKPNKLCSKKNVKKSNLHTSPDSEYSIETDYKEAPANWIPASGNVNNDVPLQIEANGHIPGWVPVDPKSRQHCWHSAAVDLHSGFGLILQPASNENRLEIGFQSLQELNGCSLELIGTSINGNPYKLGSKQKPVHLLVQHGIIRFFEPPPISYDGLVTWFEGNREGCVEGIVWHCVESGLMFKLHRHHLDLKWPVDNLKLLSLPVDINIDVEKWTYSNSTPELIRSFVSVAGSTFDSLDRISFS